MKEAKQTEKKQSAAKKETRAQQTGGEPLWEGCGDGGGAGGTLKLRMKRRGPTTTCSHNDMQSWSTLLVRGHHTPKFSGRDAHGTGMEISLFRFQSWLL